jgi:chemotaxis protein MotA
MAVALLTTLYGSLLANLVFSPMANKLGVRHGEEYLCLELICEGVEAIQAGENPKFIEEKLNMLVMQKKKKSKGGA